MIEYKNDIIVCTSCDEQIKPVKLIHPLYEGCPICFRVVRKKDNERKREQKRERV